MKKKILILGSSGMLGHAVYLHFKQSLAYEILTISNSLKFPEESFSLNVTEKETLKAFLIENKPDVVINCVGVLIKGANNDPSNAIYINAYLPHFLAKTISIYGGKLVHISTDCVFSGKKGNYAEHDLKDASDYYGMSKSLGEINYGNHLTLRTSIIGPEIKEKGEGLFDWFMNQKSTIKGFTEVYWGGVTTLTLASAIFAGIEQQCTGIYNITNGSKVSKYELLRLFATTFHRTDIEITPTSDYKIDKSLGLGKEEYFFKVPSYDSMIREMHEFMLQNKSLYIKYF